MQQHHPVDDLARGIAPFSVPASDSASLISVRISRWQSEVLEHEVAFTHVRASRLGGGGRGDDCWGRSEEHDVGGRLEKELGHGLSLFVFALPEISHAVQWGMPPF